MAQENVVHGPPIPNYLLNIKSNLSQYFIQLLGELRNNTAVIDMHDGSSFTFSNILHASFNIASYLKYEFGVQKGDVVGIFSENTIWYPSLVLAVWHIGGVSALFNPMYNNKELTHVLNITKPKIMITSKMGFKIVRNTAKSLDFIKYVCPIEVICNTRTIEENNNFEPTPCDNNQTCVILFSSGTTGLPKGVELSHKSILILVSALNDINKFVTKTDTLMGLMPMFHGYGLLIICLCLSIGSKIIVLKYFDEELFLKSIEVHKISILHAVPPLMIFLAKHPLVEKYNLSCVNVIYSGAAPLSLNIENEVINKIGKGKPLKVFQGYGMTELTMVSTLPDQNEFEHTNGSVGKLISGMSGKVIDLDNGKSLGVNESGELCFKGPMVMNGYYKNPKETASIIDAEGWLHTGDIGYYDKNHNFFIIDRIKELIKYKGYQVAPAELEALLLTHPEIKDVAVIGLPNLEAGELPMAFVVKSLNSTINEKDIVQFVHKNVSAQKRLRGGVRFVNSIPKNPSGKILRRVLKNLYYQSKL
uniref:Luciferin 4-monooxygenase n=1 Tax=Melanaphis sacchari TaxID=742174 RepID=A0A2H8TDR8_9HEMI